MHNRYGYAPDPDTVDPYPGAPKFFIRAYDTRRSTITAVEFVGDNVVVGKTIPMYDPATAGVLYIFGFAAATKNDPHDARVEKSYWEQGRQFMAWNYSIMDPTGELAFVPLAEVTEITKEQFEAGLDLIRKQ